MYTNLHFCYQPMILKQISLTATFVRRSFIKNNSLKQLFVPDVAFISIYNNYDVDTNSNRRIRSRSTQWPFYHGIQIELEFGSVDCCGGR